MNEVYQKPEGGCMKKATSLSIVSAMLLSLALIAPLFAAEPIKIGFVASITGPASFLGEPEKNTAQMIQGWVNKEGGIKGQPLEIIIEDSKSEESQAVLATKKLIENEQIYSAKLLIETMIYKFKNIKT